MTEHNSSVVDELVAEPSNTQGSEIPKRVRSRPKVILAFTGLALLLGTVFFGLRNCGNYLIVDNAVRSDVILVPARGFRPRYIRAFELLQAGYGSRIVADVPAITYIGTPAPELAKRYFAEQPELAGKIDICVVNVEIPENGQAAKCLEKLRPRKVLLVAGLFQTRRTLKAFSHDLPQYQWSITPTQAEHESPVKWWRSRDLAKIVYMEWNQLLWWELFGR